MQSYETLFAGGNIQISNFRCRCGKGGPAGTEYSSTVDAVFVRRGVFCRHVEGREEIADPNQVVFFRRDQEYRVSHPAHEGDDCTVVSFDPRLLLEALELYADDRRLNPDSPFRMTSRPVGVDLFREHWRLIRLLAEKAPKSTVEDAAFNLVERLFKEPQTSIRRSLKPATQRLHRELVNEALLQMNRSANSTLDSVSATLGVSSFNFSRIFRNQVGCGFSEYANHLRIRSAIGSLVQTRKPIGVIAIEAGFGSASYFTNQFRETVGMTPRDYRVRFGINRG